jgi:hypothetical protein
MAEWLVPTADDWQHFNRACLEFEQAIQLWRWKLISFTWPPIEVSDEFRRSLMHEENRVVGLLDSASEARQQLRQLRRAAE